MVSSLETEKLIDLFAEVNKLKTTRRAGWLRNGIPEQEAESVAEHTFRTAVIAMVFGDILKLDTEKLIKMALLHDLAEIKIGDITPYDNIPLEEKLANEEKVLRELFQNLPIEKEYIKLWLEYAQQRSSEAVILRNIDKLEMALQAKEYQNTYPKLDFNEFLEDAEKKIDDEEIKKILKEIFAKY